MSDIHALAKTIVFMLSNASRGMDIYEWEEKQLSRYPVMQKDVATVQSWIQEAVAAEREEIATLVENVAHEWEKDAVPGDGLIAIAYVLQTLVHDIRSRGMSE